MTTFPRRILLTSHSGQLGGMELRLADEARYLAQFGSHCLLAPNRFPGCDSWLNELTLESSSFEKFSFDPPSFFEEWAWHRLNFLRAKMSWPSRLIEAKIDLAHVFYSWTFYGGSRLWLCHQAGIPTVLSVHNSFPAATMTHFQKRRTAEAFSSLFGIYAVSESALQQFLATYGNYINTTTITSVIHNFVDTERFIPSETHRMEQRRELKIPDSAYVMGSIGRLDTQKEPIQVLELFERVCLERDDVYLIFCGKGPLEEEVRRRANLSRWADRVLFLGFRRDVEAVFPALDIYILLSKQEGLSLATAEAMACGIPVIVTDVPGSRDIFEGSNAGVIVPYGQPEATLEATRIIFESTERRKLMCEAARAHACSKFSKSIWEGNLNLFYQAVSDNIQRQKS